MKELIKAINNIKVELQNTELKKSGENSYANFNYFELGDFLPKLNELMASNGIIDYFTFTSKRVILTLTNGTDKIDYTVQYKDTQEFSKQIKGIQWLGSEQTYFRRYLYMLAFGIVENDIIDAQDPKAKPTPKPTKKLSPQDFMEKEAENTIPTQISKMLKQEYKTAKLVKEKMLEYGLIDENNKQANLTLEEWQLKYDIIAEDLLTKESDGINQIK